MAFKPQYLLQADTDGLSVKRDATTGLAFPYDGSITESATFNTCGLFIGGMDGWCIVLTCPSTGSPVYTVKVQASVDDNMGAGRLEPDSRVATWFDVDLPSQATVAAGSTIAFADPDAMYAWVRLSFTKTSGTIAPTIKMQMKRRGGFS